MVNWHVGQLALKKAARTGPFFNASARDDFLPLVSTREIGGAVVPRVKALIVLPLINFRMEFFTLMFFDSAKSPRDAGLSGCFASSFRHNPSEDTGRACTAW